MKQSKDKAVVYAVLFLHKNEQSPKEIAEELGIHVKTVNSIIKTQSKEETKKPNKNIPTTSSKVNSKDLMITKTEAKKINSVAVMTRAASEVNDAFKKSLTGTTESRTSKNAIYRPNK